MTSTLVLLRHGQSDWNAKNLFTGWVDANLSELGETEAGEAGRQLMDADVLPDVVHTSVLTRAIRTAELALQQCGRSWIPVRRSWRLNERHYGALQGLDKKATAETHGLEQVKVWRRSYDVPPPPLEPGSEWDVSGDARYARLAPKAIPASECLKDVVERMVPYWVDEIVPDLRVGFVTLVAAHGNSLRALVKHLKDIPDDEIVSLEIPTGVPWVFELDDSLHVVSDRWLGDPEAVKARAEAVAKQAG
jgi:2,3-bisphosphoglycerate-dependent phosphoglycerate mutase